MKHIVMCMGKKEYQLLEWIAKENKMELDEFTKKILLDVLDKIQNSIVQKGKDGKKADA